MTRIVFEREIPMPIDEAWQLVTQPAMMNLWSVAPVEFVEGDDPQRVGGQRTVRVRHFGVPLALVERAVSVDPPNRYEYVVRPNPIVRHHHAVQILSVSKGGTTLRWEVEITSWIPGLMFFLVKTMRHQLEESLDRMVAVAASSGRP